MNPILSLSFSVYSNPGVYALLIGSGVSREAQIPTGWEVTLDLIRKMAYLNNEDCEPDPATWFKKKYKEEADYSNLLNKLANSPAERSQLLKAYFEPTEGEREEGVKVPTDAHKAIANLVSEGFIKVIITTNFDPLIEYALQDNGIKPTVLASPDAVEGAMPLVHSNCTILKIHGDYLDTRIKNTQDELSSYDERIQTLLSRVFDEYGLIICGWSGEWDTALLSLIENSKSQRFTTYWTSFKGELGEKASRVANNKRAQIIKIDGANAFFTNLEEKVSSLQEYNKPHPISAKLAVATLKKYLSQDKGRIQLHDLVSNETEKAYQSIRSELFPLDTAYSDKHLMERIKLYESKIEILKALHMHGLYWSDSKQQIIFTQSLNRILNRESHSGKVVWVHLSLYPALVLLFVGGISLIAAQKYQELYTLLIKTINQDYDNSELTAINSLFTWDVLEKKIQNKLPGRESDYTPLSDYLHQSLRPMFKEILPNDRDYDLAFDKFEYLRALLYASNGIDDIHNFDESKKVFVPEGRFYWRYFRRGERENSIAKIIEDEITDGKKIVEIFKTMAFGETAVMDVKVKYFKKLNKLVRNSLTGFR